MKRYFCLLVAALLLSSSVLAQSDLVGIGEEAATLKTSTGTLFGTLVLPVPSKKRVPVVLIIAGSGPTDRNGNSPLLGGPNNAYKILAEELAKNGIASLRTDKRGIAQSAPAMASEADLRFDDYINDAVLWSKQLRADKRFSTLVIAGHSEGSLIGMVAARLAKASGYISIAGSGERIDRTLLIQLKPQLTPELYKTVEADLASLVAGKTFSDVPPGLASLFRPSVQPYMIAWLKYDPPIEIAKLKMPVLILQGKTDVQIHVTDAQALAKAQPKAKLVLIDGVNHMLKNAGTDNASQMKAYSDPTVPINPTVVSEIVAFVKPLKKH